MAHKEIFVPDSMNNEVTIGVDPALLGFQDAIAFDSTEMVRGGLSDVQITILGFKLLKGGETRQGQDGKPWVTPDQIGMDFRVDNADELGLDKDEHVQFISLPKTTIRDGVQRRGKTTLTSSWGYFMTALEGLGISGNPEQAAEALLDKNKGLTELVGLQGRRLETKFNPYKNREVFVDVFVEIYGYDNAIREQAGLEPKFTNSQERNRAVEEAESATAVEEAPRGRRQLQQV